MRSYLAVLLMLCFTANFCKAQDTVLVLSPAMFDKDYEQIFIADMNGWLFKEGSDSSWAKKDIGTEGWKKLKPADLSLQYADKNGQVEGWFRLKIKLDSSFEYKSTSFRISTWAASDFYIDGNLIRSFGNTGQNGQPYHSNYPFNQLSVPVNLVPGKEYTIALHVVDQEISFPKRQLQSQAVGIRNLIRLTGHKLNMSILTQSKQNLIYSTVWVSVCTILTLLFWLLAIQNRREKNLRLIAIAMTFFATGLFASRFGQLINGLTYFTYTGLDFLSGFLLNASQALFAILIVNIFNRRLTFLYKLFLIIYTLATIPDFIFPAMKISLIAYCVLVATCTYYIVSSWKKLKGAQWSIVAGVMITMSIALLYFFMSIKYGEDFADANLYLTGALLALPLALLVYVSMRYTEFIKEVQENAKQVVQLSEEKKEQAINQQKLLQEEVYRQTAEIRTTLDNLRSTQTQLIQSEKMASLGELTAGIAHEIQNPLNFVNNFSELNKELLQEMKEEIGKGNMEEVRSIASDVIDNSEKIAHHGKRADTIVKGMLQHSRSSSSVKEATDINALCDEYLRLSYHGLRAKDKTFNATIKTNFDESIGNLNIIPQDVGRVILNLLTNAFYSVQQKQKLLAAQYQPTVSISTKKIGNKALIRVHDNGNGVPQKVIDKIFQPFFTTKPTGEGTGLGLSLSYDIIKAHGGELAVETKEGEFAEFIITLPV